MKEYALQIQEALRLLDVPADYTKKENLIYALKESPFGDIYCIYKLDRKMIYSFALFQPEVTSREKKKVLSFLDGLNRETSWGYFHIDKVLNRVVYSLDYNFSQGTNTYEFELFCSYAYLQIKNHREALYWLITG